jgi:hypothetical protein
MVSSEVQRTLVKSPPELWAELSDPAALARHLGALGDIRITRTEPETTVEWEADNATGSVSIQASGWGTRVTLRVSREVAEAAPASPEPDESPEPEQPSAQAEEPIDRHAPRHTDGVTPGQGNDEPADSGPAVEGPTTVIEDPADASHHGASAPELPENDPIAPAPEPRLGLFARLFRRRGRKATVSAPTVSPGQLDAFAAVSRALAPEAFAQTRAFAVTPATEPSATETATQPSAAEPPDIAAELRAAEEVAAEEVTAVLTAVLDRLGAAHHRPFSRA